MTDTNTPASVSEIAPCPFCGGEAEPCHEGFGYVSVRCKGCGLVMPAKYTWDAAIAAWNTRHPPHSGDALRELVQDALVTSVRCTLNENWIRRARELLSTTQKGK